MGSVGGTEQFRQCAHKPRCEVADICLPAGLLQGLPDGSEEEQLYQFEEEMEKNSVMLRHFKSSNEQA